jgi:hypothetical protein
VTVKAIETHYAGCRFRSRLEARWAVFFDRLDIAWEYEPQGVLVTHRLTLAEESEFPYLPDFWLPGLGLWVEVKGSLTNDECLRLLDAAAALSSNNGGGCHDSGGHDIVILGPPSRPSRHGFLPWRLHMHKGDLYSAPWLPSISSHGSTCMGNSAQPWCRVATDYGGTLAQVMSGADFTPEQIGSTLLLGAFAPLPLHIEAALAAARSARFEHGERG